MRALAVAVLLAAGARALGGRERALVVHDHSLFAIGYSELLLVLRERFAAVDVVEAAEVALKPMIRDKEFVYDLVVFAAARAPNCMKLADQLSLHDFFDRGGRVLLLGDTFASQGWRLLLGLLGFDVLVPGEPLPVANAQVSADTRVVAVDRADIPFPALAHGLRSGFLFEGRPLRVTPRDTQFAGVFVPLPPTALLVSPDGAAEQSLDPTAALLAYAQGRYVPARIIAAGSARVFSNALMRLSDGDNRQLLANVLDWLDFRSMVVRVRRFAFCATLAADCAPINSFFFRQRVFLRFQATDAAGQPLTDPAGFHLQLHKIGAYMTRFVRAETLAGEPFFVLEFDAFDQLGIFRSRLGYARPGVHLDAPETEQELVFRLAPSEGNPFFHGENLPFLLVCGLVLLSAAGVFWLSAPAAKAASAA